jgi:1,4-dihydroxy-2-naphthoate octaprenyltransferase
LQAARPKTLAASIVPVALGSALAAKDGFFSLYPFLAILVAAVLIQISSNFANDVFDFERGTDNDQRVGPRRAVQSGLISPGAMKRATLAALGLTALIGVYLVNVGGLPILFIGLASLICAWGYTGGPLPLAYLGLGEVFVLFFFGPAAVSGTYFLFAQSISVDTLIAGCSTGLISSAILVVNNLRDIENDGANNKKTLAVRFGARFSQFEYALFLLLASLVPVAALFLPGAHRLTALGSLSLGASYPLITTMFRDRGAALNPLLGRTARFLCFFGASYAVGLLLH